MSITWERESNLTLFFEALKQKNDGHLCIGEWLTKASESAMAITYTTHAVKITHPMAGSNDDSADVTTILNRDSFELDGYLHTGNTQVTLDVETNARHIPVVKFLETTLSDGQKVREHIVNCSPVAESLLSLAENPVSVRQAFVDMFQREQGLSYSTSKYLPQVYFPVAGVGIDSEYHLITVLAPSSLIFEVKKRIIERHYSDKAKESKLAKYEKRLGESFSEIKNITAIGFGGTQPQNASYLNSANAGVAYLLDSQPPKLTLKPSTPYGDFFKQVSWPYWLLKSFHAMCMTSRYALVSNNNEQSSVKAWRDGIIEQAFNLVINQAFLCREFESGWSQDKGLPDFQSVILDTMKQDMISSDAIEAFAINACQHFMQSYKKSFHDEAVEFGDVEFDFISQTATTLMKEAFYD